jgi:uncharacterized protein YndB with AHSA1/START domain
MLLSDTELRFERLFHAPRAHVFEALTTPDLVKRWYGPAFMWLSVCEIDLRPGGRWRYVIRAPDGTEHGFAGAYQVIEAPGLLIRSEYYEPIGPDEAYLSQVHLDEVDGVTYCSNTHRYLSLDAREEHRESGLAANMEENFSRLADVLSDMT